MRLRHTFASGGPNPAPPPRSVRELRRHAGEGPGEAQTMSPVHAIVATNRPAVQAFFAGLSGHDDESVVMSLFSVDAREIANASDVVRTALVDVVDAAVDPTAEPTHLEEWS